MIHAETISRVAWQLASRRFCASQAAVALAVLACNSRDYYPTRPQLETQTRTAGSAIRAAVAKLIELGQLVELPGRRLALIDLVPAGQSRDATTAHDYENPPQATPEPFAETPDAAIMPALEAKTANADPPAPAVATAKPAAHTTQKAAVATFRAPEEAVVFESALKAAAKTARDKERLATFAVQVCRIDKEKAAAAAALQADYGLEAVAAALAQFAYSYTQRNRLAACKSFLGQIIAWSREPSRMDKLPAEAVTLATFERRAASQAQHQARQQQAMSEQRANEKLVDAFMARPAAQRRNIIEHMTESKSPFANSLSSWAPYNGDWRGLTLSHEVPALAAALAAAELLARSRTSEAAQPAPQAAP